MKITQNGMACCSVVVGRDATWLEHHAAQELRSYIQKISGAVLLVVPEHDAQSVPGGKILIGRPATHGMIRTFEKKAHVLPAQSDVENDCVALAVRGETLVISGSNERSVYYSVCHLLQTYFGVGFYFDGDSCTASPDMTLPDLTLVERSSFKFRHTVGQWVYNFGAFLNKEERRRELDMYARNKINSYRFYSWNTYVRKRTFQKMGGSDRTDHAGGYCAYGGDTGYSGVCTQPRYGYDGADDDSGDKS